MIVELQQFHKETKSIKRKLATILKIDSLFE